MNEAEYLIKNDGDWLRRALSVEAVFWMNININVLIPRKNDLSFIVLKKAEVLETFWISGLRELNILGPLKTAKRRFPYICPAIGQTEGILTSSVIWMYVTVKQKQVIETIRKKNVFIKVHNSTYLEFDNIFKF